MKPLYLLNVLRFGIYINTPHESCKDRSADIEIIHALCFIYCNYRGAMGVQHRDLPLRSQAQNIAFSACETSKKAHRRYTIRDLATYFLNQLLI